MKPEVPVSLNRLFALAAVAATSLGLAASPVVSNAHVAKRKHHQSRIPQHNGGDHDADNRGGPSDGDGNV
jgi:hypothetical protein